VQQQQKSAYFAFSVKFFLFKVRKVLILIFKIIFHVNWSVIQHDSNCD